MRKNIRPLDSDNCDGIDYLPPPPERWYVNVFYRNCATMEDSDAVIFYAVATVRDGT